MTTFWVWAAMFAAIALSFLLVPLWRYHRRARAWPAPGIIAAVAIGIPLDGGTAQS